MQPQLARLPQIQLQPISLTSQRLQDRMQALQRRGEAIAGDGRRPMSEQDARGYTNDMEAFFADLDALAKQAQALLQSGGAAVGKGQRGSPLPASSLPIRPTNGLAPGRAAEGSPLEGTLGSMSPKGVQARALQGAAGGLSDGSVSPSTDRRLSAIIKKVVDRMEEFETMKPRLSQLSQSQFQRVSREGEQLQLRFQVLQERGAELAGDGSKLMSERDASSYADSMEAWFSEQDAFVERAASALEFASGTKTEKGYRPLNRGSFSSLKGAGGGSLEL